MEKKLYRSHVKHAKAEFFKQLTSEIEEGKNISWDRFNKLKSFSEKKSQLSIYDMKNFYEFFKTLYSSDTTRNLFTVDETAHIWK